MTRKPGAKAGKHQAARTRPLICPWCQGEFAIKSSPRKPPKIALDWERVWASHVSQINQVYSPCWSDQQKSIRRAVEREIRRQGK